MSGFKQVVAALERRYDYHSARTLAREAVDNAGLDQKTSYEPKELKAIVQKLAGLGSEMQSVWEALEVAPRGVKLAAPPAEQPPETPAADTEDAKAPAKGAKTKGRKAAKK